MIIASGGSRPAALLLAALLGLAGQPARADLQPLPGGLPDPPAVADVAGPAGGTTTALALLDVAAAAAVPALRPPTTPGRAAAEPAALTLPAAGSGLPWRSGGRCYDCAGFGAWRGRPLDAVVLYVDHPTWDAMAAFIAKPFYKRRIQEAPQAVISLAMLPRSAPGQHAACARGAFDGYYRQFGTLLGQAGAGLAIVRLGWEANVGARSHPWGIDDAAEIPDYIGCFRREAAALKATAPGLRIEWTSSKRSWAGVNSLSFYPGDGYADLWGVHYYDTDPGKTTQAVWDQY